MTSISHACEPWAAERFHISGLFLFRALPQPCGQCMSIKENVRICAFATTGQPQEHVVTPGDRDPYYTRRGLPSSFAVIV
ncbi:MAG: hypothetical protein ACJ8BW_38345 [Ktedonobacteraceae bacterium]